jgi:5-deoxy-glucuronate isomerase
VSESRLVFDAAGGITPASAGWRYLSFRSVRLRPGEALEAPTREEETALVWLGGRAEVEGIGELGEREDVFAGRPYALLLPPHSRYALRALSPLHLALVSAPADRGAAPRVIRPDDVRVEVRGRGVTERRIHWILSEREDAARLLLVEVLTPAGHWSTYPPHKHDVDEPGKERALEELYYYRFQPERGFAFQAIYTADRSLDVSIRARSDDLVLVPRGYHVVSAAPGYDCYYLNAMAGAVREWLFTTDPEHAWLMDWQKT